MTEHERYKDIINIDRWDPVNHPRMSVQNRAAQFAPFAALSGHDKAIMDTARIRIAMPLLDPVQLQELNEKFALLESRRIEHPWVEVQYFSENRGAGDGEILIHCGRIRRIEDVESILIFQDGLQVHLNSIIDISLSELAE